MATLEKTFLGTGWSFPTTFTRLGYDVKMVSGDADIQESLWVLLSTSLGERIMMAEYGCQISQVIFQSLNTTLMTQLQETVLQAVTNWEPRITVDEVSISPDATVAGLVLITIYYVIRTTNSRSNLVYPFYLNEATIPPQNP